MARLESHCPAPAGGGATEPTGGDAVADWEWGFSTADQVFPRVAGDEGDVAKAKASHASNIAADEAEGPCCGVRDVEDP